MISREDVLYAGSDYYISPNETVPDDLIVKTQWAIESIKLSKAWDFSSGSSQVLVGIIDTGIDGTHPDLNASIRVDLSRDFSNGEEGWIPGKYIIDNQITVGPLRINDNISNNSNYGKNTVAIYAPGSNILTTSVDGYEHVSGTSLSAPYVTGVAALLLSLNEDLTAAQLKTAILEGADDIVIDVPDTSPGATETDRVEQDVLKLNALVLLNMF